jgi:hypothetical protein
MTIGDVLYTSDGEPHPITGETSRNWIIGEGYCKNTVSKKKLRELGNDGEYYPSYFVMKVDALDTAFLRRERCGISQSVERITDPKLMRKIAALIDYKPREDTR